MNTKTLQINIAQRILAIRDNKLLQKINDLIRKENIIGYDGEGKPITESQYLLEIDELMEGIDNGTEELISSNEVFENIRNAYGLD